MAIKPFEIQGSTLTIGGVDLQAGNTSIVIPGVTRATSYVPEEVEDLGDQTTTWQDIPVVIDQETFNRYSGVITLQDGWVAPTYEVQELDDDGYIDDIEVTSNGVIPSEDIVAHMEDNMFAAPAGSSIDPQTFDANVWVAIPFYVKCRAGEVENVGGGGSGDAITDGDNSLTIDGSGNAIFQGDGSGNGVNRGLEWDYGDANGGVNSKIRQDFDGLTVRAYTEDDEEDGFYSAPVNIVTNQDENEKRWQFDGAGNLTFPDGSVQTTAYTGGSGAVTNYVAVNTDGTVYGSSDGVNWSSYNSGVTSLGRVAVGPNMIVYANSADGGDGLYYAETYDTSPTQVTGFSGYNFNNLKYFSNISKFVAVGQNADNLPALLYSSNGISWTAVEVDSVWTATLNGGAGISDVSFTDIETNGIGFLITSSDSVLGAFYTTDITATLGESKWIDFSGDGVSFSKIMYASQGFFTGWHLIGGNGNDYWWQSNNTAPSTGDFSLFAIEDVSDVFVDTVGYDPEWSEVAFGQYEEYTTLMIATVDGQIMYWPAIPNGPFISIPKPYTTTITGITSASPAVLSYLPLQDDSGHRDGEKIVISDLVGFNGTYYINAANELFTDQARTTPFDATLLTYTSGGTLTFNHGEYIDALHYSSGKFYAGNDSEEMFVSNDGGATWTLTDTLSGGAGEEEYVNDIDSYVTEGSSDSQLTNGSATLTLNADGSVTFPDGTVQTTAYTELAPEPYKGFKARYGRMYASEPTISKLVIYQDTNDTVTSNIDVDTSSDLFRVVGLDNSGIIAMINVYGADNQSPVPLSNLKTFAETVIDNVILVNGEEGNFNSADAMRQAFYDNFNNFSNEAGTRYTDFQFYKTRWVNLEAPVRQGSGAMFDVIANDGDPGVYSVTVTNSGSNYLVGHKIKILGSALGGVDGVNDLILTVVQVDPTLALTVSGTADGGALAVYTNVTGTNYNVGSGLLFSVYREYANGIPLWDGYNQSGSNYVVGDVITVVGTSVNGTTPANDITVTINSVGGSGDVIDASVSGTLPTDANPEYYIYDGGSDQYDTANYIFTNLQGDSVQANDDGDPINDEDWALPYNVNTVSDGADFFGANSEYTVVYNDSIFGLFVTGANINWIGTNGNSGFDGDGQADTGSLYETNELGNFTFSEDTVTNYAGMLLETGRGILALGTDMEFPGQPSHFHIAFDGSNSSTPYNELFLGDDYNYVKIGAYASGVQIGTNSRGDGTTQHTWQFNNDGSINLPTLTVPISDNATPTGTGQTLKFNDPTQQAIIYGPLSTIDYNSAERVIIQGAPGYTGTSGEGGDVYLWAGPGGDAGGDGGDIKIRAGRGQLTGSGGYLNFQAGQSSTGNGGYINIESGSSNTFGQGGNITIDAHSGAQITLRTYNSEGSSRDLVLNNAGTLVLPGAVVKSTEAKTGIAPDTGTALTLGDATYSLPIVDGSYGPFTLGVVTFTVVVTGGVAAYTVTGTTGDTTVGDIIGTLGTEDLGGAPGNSSNISVLTVQQTFTPIDLTKSINKLADGYYSLADGVEGQVIHLVPRPAINSVTNILVTVAHARSGASQYDNALLYPFSYFVGSEQVFTSMCTLIFTDGYWQQTGGAWD